MPENRSVETDFLQKITDIIHENISNELFGVSELTGEIGMSRSNLLRKIKKNTGLSAAQFIRQVRLQRAKEMLEEGGYTVSEVSYKVGFNSASYFKKCFHEHYGYSPGETGKREEIEEVVTEEEPPSKDEKKKPFTFPVPVFYIAAALFVVVLFFIFKPLINSKKSTEKSIAVLPFKNDSNDTTNVYLINGLMESTLNNLQKIKDLRVISRTSVEKFRSTAKTSPEIAKELDVEYIVEGSGQKIGNKILLNIQLIDAKNDKHLWAEQYNRETPDIFALQSEVAKNIAKKIEVIISPEVAQRIDKAPTENLEAYDIFLKGIDILNGGTPEKARQSIPFLKKAIELDSEFARAYAASAMAYYTIDEPQSERKYIDSINYYSDRAMFYDSRLPQSLIAKALYYMDIREYQLAVPYFEKALDYKPDNIYSAYTRAYILFAKNRDLNETKDLLLATFNKGTTRIDVMQEVGKIYYYLRDYENAYRYYKKFAVIRETFHLNMYNSEDAKIGYVYSQMGFKEEGRKFLEKFKLYAYNDQSIYKHSSLALYYANNGEPEKALEHLKLFSEQNH